jgi:hypothetical protein
MLPSNLRNQGLRRVWNPLKVLRVDAPNRPDPFNQIRPEVHRVSGFRQLMARVFGTFLRGYLSTLRIRVDDTSREALETSAPPRVIVVWHNRSLVIPHVFAKVLNPRKIHCLISPSRMAAWEVDFFAGFALRSIRGSSTRRSIQAAMEMLRVLRAGDDVGLSPDGPSGPLYSIQPGAIAIARKARVPMLLIIPNARHAIRLKTWDRHLVPLPFARLDVQARWISPEEWDSIDDANAASHLRTLCLEITEDPFNATADE